MAREGSKDSSDSGDGSALPSSASWAKQRSRRGSHATSKAASSPAVSQSVAATTETAEEPQEPIPELEIPNTTISVSISSPLLQRPERDPLLVSLLRNINSEAFSMSSPITESESSELCQLSTTF